MSELVAEDIEAIRQIAEAIIASLRADLASGDPERVRETADALGLTVSPMAVVGGTSWSVRGISWYEPLKRDTLIGVGSTARHAERIKNLDIKNLDVLDSTVRWS